MALGGMDALRYGLGLRVPEDISVVGFDNIPQGAWPTYQLCYAVGRRELLRLRDAYRERAGGDFNPRRFHDELLGYGGIPVALARWGMDLVE